MGTGSFLGVQRPGRGVDHSLPSRAEVKVRVELHLYSPLGLHGLVKGELYIYCCSKFRLRAGLSGDRIPVGAKFSAPVKTGPEDHPASYTMGTGSFPWVKQPGRGVDQPPPTNTEVKEGVELYVYSPSGYSWPVLG
jgi:hypothetical protein